MSGIGWEPGRRRRAAAEVAEAVASRGPLALVVLLVVTAATGVAQVAPDRLSQAPAVAEGSEQATSAEEEPEDAAVASPIDIFAVMQAGGWALAGEEDLADYLPIPPRAQGQIGRFTRGGAVLTVARVTYPAEIFADPHEAWVRERMALLPEAHERVVRRGATVIHIRAASDADADDAQRLFEAALTASGDEG